jgi:hypothetical protein
LSKIEGAGGGGDQSRGGGIWEQRAGGVWERGWGRVGGDGGRWSMDAGMGARPAMGTMMTASWPYCDGRAASGKSGRRSGTGGPTGRPNDSDRTQVWTVTGV